MEFFGDLSKYIEQHGVHMVLNSQVCLFIGTYVGWSCGHRVSGAQFELSNHKNCNVSNEVCDTNLL